MSRAFVKEGDDMSLSDVGPSIKALSVFLTRENNGITVYEKRGATTISGRQVHHMSNGLSYTKDEKGIWTIAST